MAVINTTLKRKEPPSSQGQSFLGFCFVLLSLFVCGAHGNTQPEEQSVTLSALSPVTGSHSPLDFTQYGEKKNYFWAKLNLGDLKIKD